MHCATRSNHHFPPFLGAGDVVSLADTGTYFRYVGDDDPLAPHKAQELQLVVSRRHMTAGTGVFLAHKDGLLYMSAALDNAYVERIACE